jgi:hypothetical protein
MTTKQITIQDDNHNILLDKSSGSIPVLRFNFTTYVMTLLSSFAKIHQFDSRHDFKNAWKLWAEQNNALVQAETIHLQQSGFTGNVHDKMYKSVRYYFRQKSTVPIAQPPRKIYESMHKPILSAIDQQIKSLMQNNIMESCLSPANGFDLFCNQHMNLIIDAIRIYSPLPISITRDIIVSYTNKLKKTYKNRFYNIRVSLEKKT